MPTKRLAPHETFMLYELLTFKNLCTTKSSAIVGLVEDEELRTIFEDDLAAGQEHIQELRSLLQASESISAGPDPEQGNIRH